MCNNEDDSDCGCVWGRQEFSISPRKIKTQKISLFGAHDTDCVCVCVCVCMCVCVCVCLCVFLSSLLFLPSSSLTHTFSLSLTHTFSLSLTHTFSPLPSQAPILCMDVSRANFMKFMKLASREFSRIFPCWHLEKFHEMPISWNFSRCKFHWCIARQFHGHLEDFSVVTSYRYRPPTHSNLMRGFLRTWIDTYMKSHT